MDWKKMWGGFFAAAQEAGTLVASDGTSLPVAASIVAAEPPAPPEAQPAAAADDPAVAERIAAAEQRAREAEQRAAELETAQRQAKVSAFVEEAIRSGHALPAERDALAELAGILVADDQRFGALAALVKARPAHALTVEQVPAGITALPAARPVAGDGLTEERRRALLAATPEGRAVLAAEAARNQK